MADAPDEAVDVPQTKASPPGAFLRFLFAGPGVGAFELGGSTNWIVGGTAHATVVEPDQSTDGTGRYWAMPRSRGERFVAPATTRQREELDGSETFAVTSR